MKDGARAQVSKTQQRHHFVKHLLIVIALLSVLSHDSPAAERPNILFAIADDWGLHASAYGTRWVRTPAFDRVAREGNLPYPMRALRTKDFLYIRNFAPDRWPMGAPYAVTDASAPTATELETNTRIAFPDLDASPTKAWLVEHRADAGLHHYYDQAFAKRPAEELYDLRTDPHQTNNVASEASFLVEKNRMVKRLMQTLADTRDPRVIGDGRKFDQSPFTDPETVSNRERPKR